MALLELDGVGKDFAMRGGRTLHAVQDVSLAVELGETLGLVGESGCGKSTLARCIVGLHRPTAGSVRFEGEAIGSGRRARAQRRDLTMVFQDPFSSLNPRRRVADIVAAPLDIHGLARGAERQRRVLEMLELVGLDPGHASRYPHEFSGGQRQRIGIARALITRPRLVVCDEPVSALDVSIQAQILNLLASLRDELDLTLVFIAHDLGVVRHVSQRVAVMYLGRIVEIGGADELFAAPQHPYTAGLLAAVLVPDATARQSDEEILAGDVPPASAAAPAGCSFHPRCPRAGAGCASDRPMLKPTPVGHLAACHYPLGRPEAASAPNAR
jgi:oligopeptide/dipeptide ABC transporter ATP-binding protein